MIRHIVETCDYGLGYVAKERNWWIINERNAWLSNGMGD